MTILDVNQMHASIKNDNPLRSDIDRAVQTAVDSFFARAGHVGLSIAVIEHGATHFYNYGMTSKSTEQRPTRRSIYEIASITKTFTGALASRAILDAKMSLDDDFRLYLVEPYPNLEREGQPITLRTLAGHTSGLPKDIPDSDDLFKNPDFDRLPYQLIERERDYDEPKYLMALHDVQLAWRPGSKARYSNIGVKLISFGLERVYGDTYANLLRRLILKPLHMSRTGLTVAPRNQSLLVQGFGVSGKEMPHTLPNAGAAGGLCSTAEDLAKYVWWQLDERDPVVQMSHQPIRGNIRDFGVGLIWDEAIVEGERRLWYSGGAYGMSSQMELFPDAMVGIVLLANDGGFDTQSELDQVAMRIRRALPDSPIRSTQRPIKVEHGTDRMMTNSIGMELMRIPRMKFKMGSSEAEQKAVLRLIYEKSKPDWLMAEEPQHEVEISQPFYLGKYTVTQKQFRLVMGYNPSYFSKDGRRREGYLYPDEPAGGKEKVAAKRDRELDDFPAENMSWDEATEFCERLSNLPAEKQAGRIYRLPSEAEWEGACRGGTSSDHPFCYGDSLSSTQANFNGNYPYGTAAKGPFLERTCEVGSYPPNGFGLYDMHGDVNVWCADWYDADYYKVSPGHNPTGPSSGKGRVVRGGSWDFNGRSCRCARRNWLAPFHRNNRVGLRVVMIFRKGIE